MLYGATTFCFSSLKNQGVHTYKKTGAALRAQKPCCWTGSNSTKYIPDCCQSCLEQKRLQNPKIPSIFSSYSCLRYHYLKKHPSRVFLALFFTVMLAFLHFVGKRSTILKKVVENSDRVLKYFRHFLTKKSHFQIFDFSCSRSFFGDCQPLKNVIKSLSVPLKQTGQVVSLPRWL